MSIFNQIPKEELGTRFKYYGWFGLCPIYVSDVKGEGPEVSERNWVPEWWLEFNDFLFNVSVMLRSQIDWDYEPEYPLLITGKF